MEVARKHHVRKGKSMRRWGHNRGGEGTGGGRENREGNLDQTARRGKNGLK